MEALSIDFDSLDGCMARFTIPFEKVPNLCELIVDIHGFYPDYLPERVPAQGPSQCGIWGQTRGSG